MNEAAKDEIVKLIEFGGVPSALPNFGSAYNPESIITPHEIAPGIDLQTEVLDQMDFVPAIAPDLGIMYEGIFREKWGELGKYM